MKIVLIGCGKKKIKYKAKAKDLYTGPLFRMNLAFARLLKPGKIFILSAKYGLVNLEKKLEPYNKTLNEMPTIEIKYWAEKVKEQLKNEINFQTDNITFLAGEKYRRYLIPYLSHYDIPMKGIGIGKQLKFLKEKIEKHENNLH